MFQLEADYIHLTPEKTWKGTLDTKEKSLATFFFPMGSAWWWQTASPLRLVMDCRRLTDIKRAICFILCTDLKVSVTQKQPQDVLKIKFKQISDWLTELSS